MGCIIMLLGDALTIIVLLGDALTIIVLLGDALTIFTAVAATTSPCCQAVENLFEWRHSLARQLMTCLFHILRCLTCCPAAAYLSV